MDLSIIIPCHNLENYITPLLVSLRLQYLGNYKVELIFVCDNCTDNTKKVIENFDFNKMYSIQILERCAGSCGQARNEGFKVAIGEYIWFVDGDDWLINYSSIYHILLAIIKSQQFVLRFNYSYPPSFETTYGYFSMVWQYIFKKTFIEDIFFPNIPLDEDVVFMKQVLQKMGQESIYFLNEKIYHYNFLRSGSNMHKHLTQEWMKEERANNWNDLIRTR